MTSSGQSKEFSLAQEGYQTNGVSRGGVERRERTEEAIYECRIWRDEVGAFVDLGVRLAAQAVGTADQGVSDRETHRQQRYNQ